MAVSAEDTQRDLERAMRLVRTLGDENADYPAVAKELYEGMPLAEIGGIVDALVMLVGSVAFAGSRVGRSASQLIEEGYKDLSRWQIDRPDEEPPAGLTSKGALR